MIITGLAITVSRAEMKPISGFGISLYLSAEIIQRHYRKIWVASEVGKGSTFYFIIPVHLEEKN